MRHFCQVSQLLRDITEALINRAESFITSSFSFFVSLLRGQCQVDVLEGE